jgi:hypothetical protein
MVLWKSTIVRYHGVKFSNYGLCYPRGVGGYSALNSVHNTNNTQYPTASTFHYVASTKRYLE